MTEQNTPSVYTTPDTDGDDVLGHMKSDAAPGVHPNATTSDIHSNEGAGLLRANDTDDVEGHLRSLDQAPDFRAADKVGVSDGDDAEGHLMARDAAPDFRAADKYGVSDDDGDDVEGHKRI